MPHIFISYAKKDTRKLAEAIFESLHRIPDVTAWMDKSLEADESWALQIQQEIDRADYVIVLLSPDVNRPITETQRRSFVLNEIDYAQQDNKPILPVMAQTTKMPVQIAGIQYIDLRDSPNDPTSVVERVCRRFDLLTPTERMRRDAQEQFQRERAAQARQEEERMAAVETESPRKPTPAPAQPTAGTRPAVSSALLPTPFAWIDIPGKGYSIAKYPITNAQFARFIEADGYNQQKWWTAEGWQKCQEGWHYDGRWKASGTPWTQPRYWGESKWNGAEQPVVGVSWFEAVAFCLWLSEATGEKIMLPTEEQWQYAAQGDDGRTYPWGKDWDCKRCNNSVKPCDSNVTTPVTQYEGKHKGDSPFGVVDMAGNVTEWCLTDYDNKTNDFNSNAKNRVLRGGSWFNSNSDYFHCDYCGWINPHKGGGFRVSHS